MGLKTDTRRDDKGNRDSEQKRISSRECRRRQAGKRARHFRLVVLAIIRFARHRHSNRLSTLTCAELDEDNVLRNNRHEACGDYRFHQ